MRKLFIALLSALLCLLLSVSALAADGLSTFQETQTYQPGMFSTSKRAAGMKPASALCTPAAS